LSDWGLTALSAHTVHLKSEFNEKVDSVTCYEYTQWND